MKIGFFDSGLGGLTILRAVAKVLPEYDYVYFGDTANVPYGNRDESEIFELTKAGVAHLFDRDALIVIIACNTASAETLRRLQDEWLPKEYPDRRILGVIVPTVEALVASGIKRAMLIATTRTVSSKKYDRELHNRSREPITLQATATPELVPAIESGDIGKAMETAIDYIDPAVGEVDGLVLGCTHYTVLCTLLRERYGDTLQIFSQDEIIPHKLSDYLEKHTELETQLSRSSTRTIELSKQRPEYDPIIETLLGGRLIVDE